MNEFIFTFASFLTKALSLAIFGRVIMTWISPKGEDPISAILYQVTEPILGPIRRVVPRMGMFDLSPMVALVILYFIVPLILRVLLPA